MNGGELLSTRAQSSPDSASASNARLARAPGQMARHRRRAAYCVIYVTITRNRSIVTPFRRSVSRIVFSSFCHGSSSREYYIYMLCARISIVHVQNRWTKSSGCQTGKQSRKLFFHEICAASSVHNVFLFSLRTRIRSKFQYFTAGCFPCYGTAHTQAFSSPL